MSPVGRVLAFACIVEVGTGLAAMLVPALVIELLLGLSASADGLAVTRCFGIAVLTLGLACWPGSQRNSAAFWAMWLYNVLIAGYLAYLGAVDHVGGFLLWPAVLLHAVVAISLLWARRNDA